MLAGFPGDSGGKQSACSARNQGLIPGEGNSNPLQYSGLEHPTDRGTWQASQRIRHDFSTKPNLSLRDMEEPALKDGFLILQRKFKGGWGEICPCKNQ